MRIEQSQTIVGFYTVHVDSHELQCDVRTLPYPTCIGVIDVRVPGCKIDVWTPAASVPRGYKAAAREMLEAQVDKVMAHFKALWFQGLRVPADYGYTLEPGRTVAVAGVPWIRIEREKNPATGRYHCEPAQADTLARMLVERLQSRSDNEV